MESKGVPLNSGITNVSILRFGVFEIDLKGNELRKGGVFVSLPPQPFKILVLLASRAGEVVTREEIRAHIWGSETFVDFERGLNFAVNRIRTVLGDSADTPRYIATVKHKGYRFIAHVEALPAHSVPSLPDQRVDTSTNKRGKAHSGGWLLSPYTLTLIISGALLIAAWWVYRKTQHLDISTGSIFIELSEHVKREYAESLRGSSDELHNVWTEAQMRVALDGLGTGDDSSMLEWLEGQMFSCHCWRQQPDSTVDHISVTAWTLLAFSRMKYHASESQIRFILSNQRAGGWWPQFPSTNDDNNASTYATALSVWALYELSKKGLIPEQQRVLVDRAVQIGADWLISHNVEGKPSRWSDYQTGIYKHESIGISGLVVHVLHTVNHQVPSRIDQDWMAQLPEALPSADEDVSSGHHVAVSGVTFVTDQTHNFALPWLIIATVDAYSAGNPIQRFKAYLLLKQITRRGEQIRHGIGDKPWLAAEILMSIRYLQHDNII